MSTIPVFNFYGFSIDMITQLLLEKEICSFVILKLLKRPVFLITFKWRHIIFNVPYFFGSTVRCYSGYQIFSFMMWMLTTKGYNFQKLNFCHCLQEYRLWNCFVLEHRLLLFVFSFFLKPLCTIFYNMKVLIWFSIYTSVGV